MQWTVVSGGICLEGGRGLLWRGEANGSSPNDYYTNRDRNQPEVYKEHRLDIRIWENATNRYGYGGKWSTSPVKEYQSTYCVVCETPRHLNNTPINPKPSSITQSLII
eukprot:Tbor_TRINITY_DN2271_c0_g1::TRINITY_DN2271_c0_g1_i1::g.2705::m.2705